MKYFYTVFILFLILLSCSKNKLEPITIDLNNWNKATTGKLINCGGFNDSLVAFYKEVNLVHKKKNYDNPYTFFEDILLKRQDLAQKFNQLDSIQRKASYVYFHEIIMLSSGYRGRDDYVVFITLMDDWDNKISSYIYSENEGLEERIDDFQHDRKDYLDENGCFIEDVTPINYFEFVTKISESQYLVRDLELGEM